MYLEGNSLISPLAELRTRLSHIRTQFLFLLLTLISLLNIQPHNSPLEVLLAMERVRKTFFDPLATSKVRIREILDELPVGSAHPFSPERLLLCRTEAGVDEIDISSYPDNFFFNAVDIGEMGEILLRRLATFQSHLGMSSVLICQRVNANYL